MYVCHCEAISDRTVEAVIAAGADTVEAITDRCRAGGGCGGCHELLERMLDELDGAGELRRAPAA